MSPITAFATGTSTPASLDVTSLTSALTLDAFMGVIEAVLPIVGVAVLVGCLYYTLKWAIGLFRGI